MDLRLYDGRSDGALQMALEALLHADEEENWNARRQVDVLDYHRMALEVSVLAQGHRDWRLAKERERDAARKKARRLLRQNVSRRQWSEFLKAKVFHAIGSDGRLYRIAHQIGSSVTLVEDGVDVARFCLVPKGDTWIPEADMMLAVKLMLETNARAFLKKANMTDLRPRLRRAG